MDAFGVRQLLICLKFGTISNGSFLTEKTIENTRDRGKARKGFGCGKVGAAQALDLNFGFAASQLCDWPSQGLNLFEAQFSHL